MSLSFRKNKPLILPDIDDEQESFSISFLDWLDKYGFFVKDVWNLEKQKWSGSGWLDLFPFQKDILSHALSFNEEKKFKYQTVLYSTTKKSGKTILAAAIGAWYAEVAPAGSEIYIIANDQEQAEGRVMRDIKYHAKRRGYKINQYVIELPNGTFIQALAQSYRSVAGTRHALTLWDELWGVQSEATRRTFEEMTPIPTIPWSLRVITTYAGFAGQSDLLWDLYINGVGIDEFEEGRGKLIYSLAQYPVWENSTQFTYWNHEPTLPWQDNEYYAQQREQLRPMAYLRLHENRWVTTHEAFIPMEWWDDAERLQAPADIWAEHPYKNLPIYVGVDAAPRRDRTAVVGVAYDPEKQMIGQVFHKIWTPTDSDLDLDATLFQYLLDVKKRYNLAYLGYDPAHLYQMMIRLRELKFPLVEITQTVTTMSKISQNFYDILRFKRFEIYRDDEMRQHISNTVAEMEGSSFRIVRVNKDANSKYRKQIDYVIAAAIACWGAVQETVGETLTLEPIYVSSPFADLSAKMIPEEFDLPWMFKE